MIRRSLILIAALAVAGIVPAVAAAGAPPMAPAFIAQRGFESGEPALSLGPVQIAGDIDPTAAYWGVTPDVPGALGTNALWSGRTLTAGGARPYGTYLARTRGDATFTVSVLQDYYSPYLSFRYLLTSRGSGDADAFAVRWHDLSSGEHEGSFDTYSIPLASSWTTRTRDMSDGDEVRLSRDPAAIEFEFFDRVETPSQQGTGPAIDNIIISGYKFGPVRQLQAAPGGGSVALSWLKPSRAVDETTTEERATTFRVWRSPDDAEAWTELTATRATSASFTDTSGVPGQTYVYAVQAWDTGTGGGYGALATTTAASLPDTSAPIVSTDAVASYPDTASITISAVDTGTGVASVSWRVDGGVTQTVAASDTTVTIVGFGPHALTCWAVDTVGNTADPQDSVFTITDTIAPQVSTDAIASYVGTASIGIRATDAGSGVASISWRLDHGATQTVGASAATVTVTGMGAHELGYWATDLSGNSAAPRVSEFGINDPADPTIDIVVPSGENTVTAVITGADGDSGVRYISYSLDGSAPITVSILSSVSETSVAFAVPASAQASRSLSATVTDASGRAASDRMDFEVVDTIAPRVWTDAVVSYQASATVSVLAEDHGSGVEGVSYRLDGTGTVTVAGTTVTAFTTAPGMHTLAYSARDRQGVTASGLVTFTVVPPPAQGTVSRISGSDRYAVAVAAAKIGWPGWTGVEHVIIANGEPGKEADPLSAAGLAGAYDAPVLLTQAVRLPSATRIALTQMAAVQKARGMTLRVHIIGGTASVPDARWNEIRSIPGVSASKDRIAGADRYSVTAAIANRIIAVKGTAGIQGVLIVNAENSAAFYDALAASPIAYAAKMPMLGVRSTVVPPSVKAVLAGPLASEKRYVVSAPSYVSNSVYTQVRAEKRLTVSTNRHTSAASISTHALSNGWLGAASVGVASKLPDALTGGAFLGRRGGPLLFTEPSVLPAATGAWLGAHKSAIRNAWILGGTMSVTDSVKSSVAARLK